MLVRHSGAFALYLIATAVFFTGFTIYIFKTSNSFHFVIFNIEESFYYICSLFSELLLIKIFWDLGKKIEKSEKPQQVSSGDQERESEVIEVTEEDFDEDDELQANIWNSMVRLADQYQDEKDGDKQRFNFSVAPGKGRNQPSPSFVSSSQDTCADSTVTADFGTSINTQALLSVNTALSSIN